MTLLLIICPGADKNPVCLSAWVPTTFEGGVVETGSSDDKTFFLLKILFG